MRKLISTGILIIIIASCKEKESKIILTDYYKDGRIESTTELNKDSIIDGRMITYYPNGNIKMNVFFVKEKVEGELTRYFESGKVETIENYSNHKMHGQQIAFFENGKKKALGNYYHGLQVGKYYEFYDNESNSINIERYYYIHGDKSSSNTTTEYDERGTIIYGSPYLDIKLLDDSIEIRLQRPKYKNMYVITGDYDQFFNLRKTNSNDTTQDNGDFKIRLAFTKRDTIRGYVDNWDFLTDSTGVSQFIHFSYPDIWK